MSTPLGAQLAILLQSMGIDHEGFQRFLVWALSEHLVTFLSEDRSPINDLRSRQDGMKQFRNFVRQRTHRNWSPRDIEALYSRVLQAIQIHHRKPVTYENLLRLLFNSKHECVKCRRKPPEVKLHIDHIFPASKGGSSRYGNLRFLCEKCNLEKSDKVERSGVWLNFE